MGISPDPLGGVQSISTTPERRVCEDETTHKTTDVEKFW